MIHAFIDSVLLLSTKYPFSVTSWLRTQKHNTLVGGHPFSWHMLALAVDVVLDDHRRNEEFERDARRLCLNPVWEDDCYHLGCERELKG